MNDRERLKKHTTDHLLLLVGTNPLPNYVAAKLLTSSCQSTVYLLHSEGTARIAEQILSSHISGPDPGSSGPFCKRVLVEESNPSEIYQEVSKVLKKAYSGSIGLNYTGGTKAMSVHAYRAVEKSCEESGKQPVFTYLDARRLEMCIDPGNSYPRQRIHVGEALELQLEKVFGIHNIRLKECPTKRPRLLNVSKALVDLFTDESGEKVWRNWRKNELRNKARDKKKDKWKRGNKLKKIKLAWPPKEAETVTKLLRQALDHENHHELDLGQVEGKHGLAKIADFCSWLDGQWIESYVLDAVHQNEKKCSLGDFGMNFSTEDPYRSKQKKFEFDVAAMKGYQLFAISCTTSKYRSACKLKLFEAYVRARQLGGEEARVGLVCCYRDADEIRREVEDDWDAEKRITVFGINELPDLAERLADWFNTANT